MMLRYLVLFAALTAWAEDGAYRAAIAKWREGKQAELTADGGWLTVTGLVWLKEGDNRVANAPGVFALHGGKTVYRPDSGAAAVEMGENTSVDAGELTLSVIERGGRYGVRVKDKRSKLRTDFRG
jgi:uncharacterized protein